MKRTVVVVLAAFATVTLSSAQAPASIMRARAIVPPPIPFDTLGGTGTQRHDRHQPAAGIGAGLKVLQDGGNAIDAAVAAARCSRSWSHR